MEEIIRFLQEHPPFSLLPADQIQAVAEHIQIEYFATGQDILTQGGAPAEFLYLLRRGVVTLLRLTEQGEETLDTLGEGDTFGFVSLIRDRPPVSTVRAQTDTLVYLLPAGVFHRLRQTYPPFEHFFTESVGERLALALQSRQASAVPELFQTRLRDLVRRELVAVAPSATIREAAQTMRDHHVSCLVVDLPPYGILDQGSGLMTDRDLRNRVLAAGLSDQTPVSAVMTTPITTMPADSLVFEGLLVMLEKGYHHLPLTQDGLIIGMVTHTDILRQQSRSPLFLPRQLERSRGVDDYRAYAEGVSQMVGSLLEAGARVSDIGRIVAVSHDALLVRLLKDAEAEFGPPPCPYAWLVLGSEGRFEQTLRTDQDNALVYADDAPPNAETYFARLAERVVGRLVEVGFPRCPGDIMATNPEWRQPLRVWQGYFHRWIHVPSEEALLRVAIFFDFRRVYGELDAEAALWPLIQQAPEQRIFLARLARTATRQPAPLGFFQRLILERKGEERDLLDLKLRGTGMIVDLARLFALEAGVAVTNTLARLRQSAARSQLSQEGADDMAAAFEFLSLLRLRHQYELAQRGETPTNLVPVKRLSRLEQRELKETLRVVGQLQQSVEFAYHTGRLA